MQAYADCWMPNNQQFKAMQIRNLNFRDDKWLILDDWETEMYFATPDDYNAFRATSIADTLRYLLNDKTQRIKLQIAREGSVACYISADLDTLQLIATSAYGLLADEADIINNELRLWWD